MKRDTDFWQALLSRDARYDGVFFYGVITTGVYCKPSCKSRSPQFRNVRFFNSAAAAEKFGLRACKKCVPNQTLGGIEQVVHELCRYLQNHSQETVSLTKLARKSGYSASHLQKAFVKTIGMSPKAYHNGLRRQQLKSALQASAKISDAIYNAGYGSPSRVYEKLAGNMGMTPKQYRAGGKQMTIHYATSVTSLGATMIAATARGICFLQFGKDNNQLRAALHAEFPNAAIAPMPEGGQPRFAQWVAALNAYLDKNKKLRSLPLDIRGTAFQLLVWRYLQTIPAGEVRSYAELAKAIGKPRAARAVASACAKNPIGILVPCHRVLRGDGQMAGYRWGIERKRRLLAIENAGEA